MKKVIFSVTLLFSLSCVHQVHNRPELEPATIPVENERLYLAPLVVEASLENLSGWPQDPTRQKILLKTVNDIWNRLKGEFRRCEKLGLYEMVEDTQNPSMRISVTIISAEIVDDTLRMPVRLQAERLPDGQKFIYSIPALATAPSHENDFHFLGLLLGDYKRNFPGKLLVSFFYPH